MDSNTTRRFTVKRNDFKPVKFALIGRFDDDIDYDDLADEATPARMVRRVSEWAAAEYVITHSEPAQADTGSTDVMHG